MSESKVVSTIKDLTPDPQNANKGTERGVEMLEQSLRSYGAGRSLLIDKNGVVIAGNKTLEAAASIGLTDVIIVPTDGKQIVVVQRTDLDLANDPRAKALGVADNRVAQIGLDWDGSVISSMLAAGTDLSKMFTVDELAAIVTGARSQDGRTDPDAVPEPHATDIARGDVFQLGRHRLICGDSTNAQDVATLLGGVVPLLMVTDPPYGVEYSPEWRREAGVNDSARMGKVSNDDRADWTPAWRLFPGDVAYVWHAALHSDVVQDSLEAAGFEMRSQIVWKKPRFVLSRGHYHWQHEPAFYAVRRGRSSHWGGSRKQATTWTVAPTVHRCQSCGSVEIDASGSPDMTTGTVWDVAANEEVATVHSTQKPVECMARAMRNHATAEVYEPFSGSGSSLIAAEQTGRSCYAIELSPVYVQVAIERWEAFTGQKAVKIGAGHAGD